MGDNLGTDDALFDQSNFDGSVYPDLPVVGPEMAGDIDAAIRQRVQEESAGEGLIIRTVAAQCLDAERIARKIERSGNLFRGSKGVRGALLCVSGGDRGRRSGKVGSSELKDSRFIIEAAASMRSRGEIPAHVDLWAVANPMTDSVDSFKYKVDAGARCFLTQPHSLPGAPSLGSSRSPGPSKLATATWMCSLEFRSSHRRRILRFGSTCAGSLRAQI